MNTILYFIMSEQGIVVMSHKVLQPGNGEHKRAGTCYYNLLK